MNVSPEANSAFMRALKKEDPRRYVNLIRNMKQSVIRNGNTAGCGNCGGSLAHLRAGTVYCSESCKKQSQRVLDVKIAA
jgi:hypothetical protein